MLLRPFRATLLHTFRQTRYFPANNYHRRPMSSTAPVAAPGPVSEPNLQLDDVTGEMVSKRLDLDDSRCGGLRLMSFLS